MITLQEGWYRHALSVAMRLHAGQMDVTGEPRWFHCQQTAWHLIRRWPEAATRDQVEAAVLHDVLAYGAKARDLRQLSIHPYVIEIVQHCTPIPGYPMLAWLHAIGDTGDADTMRVLIADYMDVADPERPYPSVQQQQAKTAIAILETYLHKVTA